MSELRVTHTSSVTEDQIDHLGHMNVRYYAVNARRATHAVLADLGWDDPAGAEVFDVYTRHHHEQLLGTKLHVRSGLLGADGDSIRIYHELANAETGDLAATFIDRVRTNTPKDHLEVVDLPAHGTPRSIDLASTATTPSLDMVRDLGLAMRAPRVIDGEDTGDTDTVLPHLVPMLIWGGTPPDGSTHELVHTGPGGESMGWATLETRIGVGRLPTIGTRIQSFGATTSIADKTTQMSMWAFDLDTGAVIASFEVVSVLFDIGARRAMSIPDDMRAQHEKTLHPELGAH
ncbi:thioesterase family protein [Ilumatobacter nonamiensis]|uniref:thioesterase family protein n=1 Tax=Ilumatobacter nonamiensis TaxID=467093 RepID=UPI000349917C|nr:thioesterase family protein [Ilumatobacter nonamiensis]